MSSSTDLFDTLLDGVESGENMDRLENRIWDQFGTNVAVLVLDSTGFSKTTQKRGIVYFLSIVAKMRAVGRKIFSSHGVLRVRAEADNLFAEFPSTESALKAAFEIHQYFKENEVLLFDDESYKVCIGIGYGRLLESIHEGMYGDEMNLASKLGEDTAKGGETLITEAAYESLSSREGMIARRRFVTISGVELPYFEVEPN